MPEQSEEWNGTATGGGLKFYIRKRIKTEQNRDKRTFLQHDIIADSLFLRRLLLRCRRLHLAKGLKFFLISAVAQHSDEKLPVSFCLSKSCFNRKILILSFAVDTSRLFRTRVIDVVWHSRSMLQTWPTRHGWSPRRRSESELWLRARWDMSLNTRTHP